ncbi:glycosyltransferase family 2 protein [Variovorax atrisoli]|uniref:glycosyltransferase family 2 protein n=1 Tax=Variovorax atrisoli TaxID=3394203 RepID=UPI003396B032
MRATVMIVDTTIDASLFREEFPYAELVEVDTRLDQNRFVDARQHPPAAAYSNTVAHWRSACVFRALAELSKMESIAYVEFPDAEGLAFCTLQECRLQGFLAGATVAVRLHGSHTALLHAEPRPLSISDLNLSDLERKCLRDCDYIVASSTALSEATRAAFDFSEHEWTPRVVFHQPLAALLHGSPPCATSAYSEQRLVFGSEFQRFGRPDLFVRGAIGFLQKSLTHLGPLTLYVRDVDIAYREQIKRLIPRRFLERCEFIYDAEWPEFDAHVGDATVVFSGTFESAEGRAVVASSRGARVILNQVNPAFGEGTCWVDGINCLKFDGTASGLIEVLERNFDFNQTLRPVVLSEGALPWLSAPRQRTPWRPIDEAPMVSVVVPHYNLGGHLPATLDNLAKQNYRNIEIVVVDDASTDARSERVIEELASNPDPRIKVVRLAANVGLAAARNVGVRHSSGRYVLTLDADDLIHPRFLEVGVAALENSSEFDIVVTPAGYFLDNEGPPSPDASANFCDYAMFSGEAVVAGLLENRFSTATALFRRSTMVRFPYIESLNCYEDWSVFMRMCDAGCRFIVTTDVFFFYRRRPDSMVHAPRDLARQRIEYSDLLRTSSSCALRQKSRYLMVGLGAAVAGNRAEVAPVVEKEAPKPMPTAREVIGGLFGPGGAYDEEVVFASLKASRWLERRAPWVIQGAMVGARWTWRVYRAVRGLGK